MLTIYYKYFTLSSTESFIYNNTQLKNILNKNISSQVG